MLAHSHALSLRVAVRAGELDLMELEEAFRYLRRKLATARERAEGAQLMRCVLCGQVM